jgi:uncharacterized protein (UPF0335 family)
MMKKERQKLLQGYIGEIELWMQRKVEIQASISEIYATAKPGGSRRASSDFRRSSECLPQD